MRVIVVHGSAAKIDRCKRMCIDILLCLSSDRERIRVHHIDIVVYLAVECIAVLSVGVNLPAQSQAIWTGLPPNLFKGECPSNDTAQT